MSGLPPVEERASPATLSRTPSPLDDLSPPIQAIYEIWRELLGKERGDLDQLSSDCLRIVTLLIQQSAQETARKVFDVTAEKGIWRASDYQNAKGLLS